VVVVIIVVTVIIFLPFFLFFPFNPSSTLASSHFIYGNIANISEQQSATSFLLDQKIDILFALLPS